MSPSQLFIEDSANVPTVWLTGDVATSSQPIARIVSPAPPFPVHVIIPPGDMTAFFNAVLPGWKGAIGAPGGGYFVGTVYPYQ